MRLRGSFPECQETGGRTTSILASWRVTSAAVADPVLLTRTPFFAGLDEPAVEAVAARCERRELHRNDVLFRQGEAANELFVVESGRVAIANRSDDGRESLVALMEPGDLFG